MLYQLPSIPERHFQAPSIRMQLKRQADMTLSVKQEEASSSYELQLDGDNSHVLCRADASDAEGNLDLPIRLTLQRCCYVVLAAKHS